MYLVSVAEVGQLAQSSDHLVGHVWNTCKGVLKKQCMQLVGKDRIGCQTNGHRSTQ